MLRLVDAPLSAAGELRHVAVWALESELVAYLERHLQRRWPRLRVQRINEVAQLATSSADLCICGAPPPPLRMPILWLGEIDRGTAVTEISTQLWQCRMPITGRHLLRLVDAIWRNRSS